MHEQGSEPVEIVGVQEAPAVGVSVACTSISLECGVRHLRRKARQ